MARADVVLTTCPRDCYDSCGIAVVRQDGVVTQFAPISWDEAITSVAAQLQRIVAATGPEAVAYAHYTGTFSKIAYAFPARFFNRLDATEVEPDTICTMAGHVALQYTLGSSLIGFDPRTAKDARCIVVWAPIHQRRRPTHTSTGSARPPAGRS